MSHLEEKTYSINNFIGVYDNYIIPEECNKAIKLFEDQDKFNNTLNRLDFEQSPVTQKQDQQYFANPKNISVWWEELKWEKVGEYTLCPLWVARVQTLNL